MNLRKIMIMISIAICTLAMNPVYADETFDPVDLLPSSNSIENFRMNPPEPHEFAEQGMYAYMNGAAEIFFEFGVVSGCSAEYESNGKYLTVELFKMKSPDAAYGIYSVSNYTSAANEQIEHQLKINDPNHDIKKNLKGDNYNLIGDVAIEFFKNDVYGRITISEEDRFHLMAFANRILAKIPKHASRPKALSNLPRIDMIPGSERYAVGILGMNEILDVGRGDIWGLHTNAEVVAGEYRLSAGNYYSMIVINYRVAEIANSSYNQMMQVFNNLEEYRAVPFTAPDQQRVFLVSDRNNKYMGFRQLGTRVEIFTNMNTPTQFKMILEKDPNISVRHSR